ncbi:MAG: PAS domain-containing protein [Chloroflexota bacterium]
MSDQPASEAVISLDRDGRYLDANAEALDMLGVSIDELRTSAPDRFAIRPSVGAEQAALRSEWESGRTQPLVGTTGLRRADGTTIRVAYAIEPIDLGFRARLRRVEGSPHDAASVYSVGDVLREWRTAERELAELTPGTPGWARTLDEIELLRERYQEIFRALKPAAGDVD